MLQVTSDVDTTQTEVFAFIDATGYEQRVVVSNSAAHRLLDLMNVARAMSDEEYKEIVEIINNIKE